MNDAGRISTIMHLLGKSYVPIRVEHIGIRILGRIYVMNMSYALCICIMHINMYDDISYDISYLFAI